MFYEMFPHESVRVPIVDQVCPPTLGPYQSENRLECVNRCRNLLKYFRYCHQAKGLWASRLSDTGVTQNYFIDASHIPAWLRPPQEAPGRPATITKTSTVATADALAPIEISIVWDQAQEFDGKEELDETLVQAKAKGTQIPRTHQKPYQDPRLCPSAASFKDAIRRQFNC